MEVACRTLVEILQIQENDADKANINRAKLEALQAIKLVGYRAQWVAGTWYYHHVTCRCDGCITYRWR